MAVGGRDFNLSFLLSVKNTGAGALDAFGRQLKSLKANAKELGEELGRIGGSLSRYVGLPMAAIGVASVKMANDFNKSMANIGTLIPNQRAHLEDYKKALDRMSRDMGISAMQLAEGAYQIISAFGDTADTMKIVELNAKAAAAGQATLEQSMAAISAVTKSYGDNSLEAQKKAADLAFMTVKLGQTTFPELAESMGDVASVSAALGVSQEELFTAFATMTGPGGNTRKVTTQIAGAMRSFLKPSDAMNKRIRALGYQSGFAMVKELGLGKSIMALNKHAKGSKVALGEMFTESEALKFVLTLTGGQADVFVDKLAQMQKASGSLDEAFKEQTEGINKMGYTWGKATAAMASSMRMIGDALAPFVGHLAEAIAWVSEFAAENPKLFKFVIVMAGAIAMAGVALTAISGAIALFVGAGISAVALGIAAAFTAVAAAIGTAILYWDELVAEFKHGGFFISALELLLAPFVQLFIELWDLVSMAGKFIGLNVPSYDEFMSKSQVDINVRGTGGVVPTIDKTKGAPVNVATDSDWGYAQ